jgi:hypothetical protein
MLILIKTYHNVSTAKDDVRFGSSIHMKDIEKYDTVFVLTAFGSK